MKRKTKMGKEILRMRKKTRHGRIYIWNEGNLTAHYVTKKKTHNK